MFQCPLWHHKDCITPPVFKKCRLSKRTSSWQVNRIERLAIVRKHGERFPQYGSFEGCALSLRVSPSAPGLPPRRSTRSRCTAPSVRGWHVDAWVEFVCIRFFISDAFDWTVASVWPFNRSRHSSPRFLFDWCQMRFCPRSFPNFELQSGQRTIHQPVGLQTWHGKTAVRGPYVACSAFHLT